MSTNPTFEPTEAADAEGELHPLGGVVPSFLVACAGSGTSVLARALDAHPGVTSVEEPGGPWSALPAGTGGSDRLTADHATPDLKQALRRWAAERHAGSTVLLDSDPRNGLRVPFLRAVFPEATFLHVVRDGRDVARALMAQAGGDEWVAPRPPSWRELKAGASGYLRCALVWREIVETILTDLEGETSPAVRFEDLMEHPEQTAERVASGLGLTDRAELREAFAEAPVIARSLPHARRYAVRRWRAVAVERPLELRAANLLISDVLERLGYDPAPAELAKAPAARLPRSVLFEFRRLERMVEARDERIGKLEQDLVDLERAGRLERRAAERARAALAAAEQRTADEAEARARDRRALTERVREAEAARGSAMELLESARAEQRRTERRLEAVERGRSQLLDQHRRLMEGLDAAETALRRTAGSRSWRLGHWLARVGAALLGRRPGHGSALDGALEDVERVRRQRGA